jgi:hypothetical protein
VPPCLKISHSSRNNWGKFKMNPERNQWITKPWRLDAQLHRSSMLRITTKLLRSQYTHQYHRAKRQYEQHSNLNYLNDMIFSMEVVFWLRQPPPPPQPPPRPTTSTLPLLRHSYHAPTHTPVSPNTTDAIHTLR